jgi:hypothetical protein
MMQSKDDLIYDTKLTISQKHILMCFANHVYALDKSLWDSIPPAVHVSWLQHEFTKLLTKRTLPGAIHAEFKRHVQQCKSKGLFAEHNEEYVTFKQEHLNFAIGLTEPFTADEYASCNLKNVTFSPIAKKANHQQEQTSKSNAAPFWKPAPSLEKQEEQKADVYMMSVNILEKLQPMLLNLIYEELSKEVNHAA